MTRELFLGSVQRAHRYRIDCLHTLERIALLHLKEAGAFQLPSPAVDQTFRERPAYLEGSLTEAPDLSRYE